MSLNMAAISLTLGILPLLVLPALPAKSLLLVLGIFACYGVRTRCYGVALAAFGFVWGCGNASLILAQTERFTRSVVSAEVGISSERFAESDARQLLARLWMIDGKPVFPPLYARLEASPALASWCGGQRWRMRLQLRPVHSRLNEGGFDRQRWAVSRLQPLTGRILAAEAVDPACGWRQQWVRRMEQQTASLPWRAILIALAMGDMASVDDATRELLQKTGTLHLMAISGLHIALAAMLGWGAIRGVQLVLPLSWVDGRLPMCCGVLVAWAYVWLAGGNPPAIRAALALSVWAVVRLRGISVSAWQVWLWCIGLILLAEPFNVLSDSFWLSALAVAALIFWYQWAPLSAGRWRGVCGWWVRALHLQIGITLLLVPLQVLLFQGISLSSLPANLWAVPLVSLITTPLVLVTLPLMVFSPLAHALWWLADRSLALVFALLQALPDGWLPAPASLLPFSALGWLAVISWRLGWWRSQTAGLLALMLWLALRPRTPSPQWRVDMLDVGHGLAVVIERQGKAVLYDTGARWEGGDSMTRDILPYLRWRGLRLEQTIISHNHQDHSGGLPVLRRQFPLLPVYGSQASADYRPCVQGASWYWQGLRFEVLWPVAVAVAAGNHDSCVIRVTDGRFSLLLTGDLEREDEVALLKTQRLKLASDVIQVPHHGSSTSSSAPFLRAVGATAALSSNARYNPWRLPSSPVVRRYREQGIRWYDTAGSGQVSVRFFSDGIQILRYRGEIAPRWYHRWFGAQPDNE
ncbi:ComEC family protein [Musicola paradisiaca]|nr:ComEC family protein [Musicola paradisiaca]